jgi:hypothetical protein
MPNKKKFFNYKENPFFNAFVHFGMLVKILMALGIIVGIWYYL